MLRKRAAMLLLLGIGSLSLLGVTARGQDKSGATERRFEERSAMDLLLGGWEQLSHSLYPQAITVGRHFLTIGDCKHIPYKVIRDRPGHGASESDDWREIAVELQQQTNNEQSCSTYRVLDFFIPHFWATEARIRLFDTRAEFDKKDPQYYEEGYWVGPGR